MGTTGTIAEAAETPRSYLVETENGTVRRNRSHVNPIPTSHVEKKQARDKALTPLKQLASPCLSSRPKRLIRPSLKLQESLGLC
ncbi:unnamed protein product [Porites evermanni]|uniref:Uncharacterized protein n=1 Tax=Porites evermanni TaxID=104178 RepID=A0ABN8LVX1_9CNID|nr:unnamed protein product [Porites evermanni]